MLVAVARDQPVSGWLTYTLAWAEVEPNDGVGLRPEYDVRHVANLVLRWEIIEGLIAGGRVHARSGGPRGSFYRELTLDGYTRKRFERELEAFYRVDLSLAYRWDAGWGRLRATLEWLNVTYNAEAIGLDCEAQLSGPPRNCGARYAPVIFAPNLGLRIEL